MTVMKTHILFILSCNRIRNSHKINGQFYGCFKRVTIILWDISEHQSVYWQASYAEDLSLGFLKSRYDSVTPCIELGIFLLTFFGM